MSLPCLTPSSSSHCLRTQLPLSHDLPGPTGLALSFPITALQPQTFRSLNKKSLFLPQQRLFLCQEQSCSRSLHGWFLLILVSAQTSPPHGGDHFTLVGPAPTPHTLARLSSQPLLLAETFLLIWLFAYRLFPRRSAARGQGCACRAHA